MSDRQEVIDLVVRILAGLAVATQIALALALVAALAALLHPGARSVLDEARRLAANAIPWIAFVIAAVATAGSLFFSEYANFIPCELCWYQRIAMYPLAIVLLVAALRRDARGAAVYGLPLAAIGAAFSAYHIYVENNPEASFCSTEGSVPCDIKWINELGYVTIPTLALTAFLAIGLLLALFALNSRDAG